jgi:DNA-binding transcriptional MerR regulator
VLRYWEQEFQQLSPCKRRGNRRYYQYKDVVAIRQIRELLYDKGFTIIGARKFLNQQKRATKVTALQPVIQSLEAVLNLLVDK